MLSFPIIHLFNDECKFYFVIGAGAEYYKEKPEADAYVRFDALNIMVRI